MVQYAEIRHFYQKSGENENFYLPVIFKVIRVMSSYISQIVHRTINVVTSISLIPADLWKKIYPGVKKVKNLPNHNFFFTFLLLDRFFYTNLLGSSLY